MTTLLYLAITAVCITAALDLVLIFLWKSNSTKSSVQVSSFPQISILIAARNEEKNIRQCIESMLAQDYPADRMEILVGNDASEDNTLEILNDLKGHFPTLKVLNITTKLGTAKGKSNVLAQLAQVANGEYFLITDADVVQPTTWAIYMVANAAEGFDIVTGMTVVRGDSFFATMQRLDWILALGMVKVVSDLGTPITSMGNNMLIKRAAYEQTGGYQQLPFSITEDFQLFRKVVEAGGKTINLMQREITGYTHPIATLGELLHQRKRWMTGAVQLPFIMVLTLLIQALFFPFTIFLAFQHLGLAAIILGAKIFFQAIFIRKVGHSISINTPLWSLWLFEFYSACLSLSLMFFYLMPTSVVWKGRNY
jgi:cellulose synthase/poly-beta-1,6-N-acetylglucosamine synthase-like glycosyltransferase